MPVSGEAWSVAWQTQRLKAICSSDSPTVQKWHSIIYTSKQKYYLKYELGLGILGEKY